MGSKQTVVESGGGAATGFAQGSFAPFLRDFLAGPNQAGNVAGNLGELIGGFDVSGMGKTLQELIQREETRGVSALRERFGQTGTTAGTPAAVGEATFRAETGPKGALALGQLDIQNRQQQLAAIMPILQLSGMFAGMGTAQRRADVISEPSGFVQGLQGLAGLSSFLPGLGQIAQAGGFGEVFGGLF